MSESSSAAPQEICALVLTYGDRFRLLLQTLEALKEVGVERALVVGNAPRVDLETSLAAVRDRVPARLELLVNPKNLGSAGGYGRGLEHALTRGDVETIWLLDDDNVPEAGSLTALREAEASLRAGPSGPLYALASLRSSKRYMAFLASGEAVSRVYPRPGSFSGVSVSGTMARALRWPIASRAPSAPPSARAPEAPVRIPWAPWGGLWLPRRTLEAVGLPRAELFLYADDTEYTFRVTAMGGGLFLVPRSVVRDADEVRLGASQRSVFRILLDEPDDARVYYHLRNQTYFERFHHAPAPISHAINRCVFEALLAFEALSGRRAGRLRLLRRAIRDGLEGRLGRRPELGL